MSFKKRAKILLFLSFALQRWKKFDLKKKKWKRRRSSFWTRFVLVMMLFLLLAFRWMCWRLFIYSSLAVYFVYLFIWLCLKRHMRCVCVMCIDTASTSNYFLERDANKRLLHHIQFCIFHISLTSHSPNWPYFPYCPLFSQVKPFHIVNMPRFPKRLPFQIFNTHEFFDYSSIEFQKLLCKILKQHSRKLSFQCVNK